MASSSFLRNKYWVLRHGKSIPNEKGLIVSSLYAEIWAMDEKDPFTKLVGGESVDDVASRLASAMATMESEYQGCVILVVSHGNPLQILHTQCSFRADGTKLQQPSAKNSSS